jgi:hypothetical protein
MAYTSLISLDKEESDDMHYIDSLPSKPPVRRICADFQKEAAVEVDMLEVQIGINRAARNKTERDAVLMELALLSLRKHVEAFSSMTGDKYPDYQAIARWLESGDAATPTGNGHNPPEVRQNALISQNAEYGNETVVHGA